MDLQPPPAGPGDLLHRLLPRDVDDDDGQVHELGVGDRPVRRLALHQFRPRQGVAVGRRLPGPLQLLAHVADGVVALGMDHHAGALPAGEVEHVEDLPVVQDEVVVGHEDLERGVALGDQGRQLLAEHRRRRVRDDQVDRHVDVALALGQGPVGVGRLPQRRAPGLEGEGHHAGVAAGRRRPCRGGEVVGHDDAGPGGLRDVDVAVDAPRQHEEAGGIDGAGGIGDPLGHGGDAPVADADVGAHRVGGSHHRAVADGEVELGHGVSSSRGR